MRKIFCFFGIHKFGLNYSINPLVQCECCGKSKLLEYGKIPTKYIPIRNVQNGDNIRLIQSPPVWNSLSGCYDNNVYDGFTGVVADVDSDEYNSFVIDDANGVLICPPIGRTSNGGAYVVEGRIYEMDGKIYRCEK